jgi:hypothetical protein
MIAPSEPSSFTAAVDLVMVMLLKSSEAKTLKSKPRLRLPPPVAMAAARHVLRVGAVQPRHLEIAAQAAHRDRAPLAVVAVDRNAGQPLDRFRQIGVGEVGDVLRGDRIDDLVRAPLEAQGALQRSAETGNNDLLPGLRVGHRLARVRIVLRLGPGHGIARFLCPCRRNACQREPQRAERRAHPQLGPAGTAHLFRSCHFRPPLFCTRSVAAPSMGRYRCAAVRTGAAGCLRHPGASRP